MPKQSMDLNGASVNLVLQFSFTCTNTIHFTEEIHRTLHHHTYTFEVKVASTVNDRGLATDFDVIKSIFTKHIQPKVEGQHIDQTLPVTNTTAECIAYWLCSIFVAHLPKDDQLVALKLYETPEQAVSLTEAQITAWRSH